MATRRTSRAEYGKRSILRKTRDQKAPANRLVNSATGLLTMQPDKKWIDQMNKILVLLTLVGLQGCTILAVADAAGSAAVYAVKTVVNTVDAVTPDVVNKKK